jgi:hypothetical protein
MGTDKIASYEKWRKKKKKKKSRRRRRKMLIISLNRTKGMR